MNFSKISNIFFLYLKQHECIFYHFLDLDVINWLIISVKKKIKSIWSSVDVFWLKKIWKFERLKIMRVGNRQRAHWEEMIWTSNLSIESDCTSFSSVFHGNLFITHSFTYRTKFQFKSINTNHTMSTRWKIRWNRNRPNFRPVKLQFYHTPPHFR